MKKKFVSLIGLLLISLIGIGSAFAQEVPIVSDDARPSIATLMISTDHSAEFVDYEFIQKLEYRNSPAILVESNDYREFLRVESEVIDKCAELNCAPIRIDVTPHGLLLVEGEHDHADSPGTLRKRATDEACVTDKTSQRTTSKRTHTFL